MCVQLRHSSAMTTDQWFDLAQTISDIVSPVLAALAAEILRARAEAERDSHKKKDDDKGDQEESKDDDPESTP